MRLTKARNSEIDRTNVLLEKVSGKKTELFRAPYGARDQGILRRVNSEGLRSVMWSIDSLDWADVRRRAARWLASPAAAFITGQTIRVNGGAVRG